MRHALSLVMALVSALVAACGGAGDRVLADEAEAPELNLSGEAPPASASDASRVALAVPFLRGRPSAWIAEPSEDAVGERDAELDAITILAAYDVSRLPLEAPDARAASAKAPLWNPAKPRRLERLLAALDTAGSRAGTRPRPWSVGNLHPFRLFVKACRREAVVAFEEALDHLARVGGDAVTLTVEVFEDRGEVAAAFGIAPPDEQGVVETPDGAPSDRLPRAIGRLVLDAPSDHHVRAFSGTSLGYLADYDVEISQAAMIAEPMVGSLDVGIAASGRVDLEDRGAPRILLDVARMPDVREFSSFRSSLASSSEPISIELPRRGSGASFQGSVPARPGSRWLVGLSHGAGALVWVGPVVSGPPSVPGWTVVDPFEPPGQPARDNTGMETLDVVIDAPQAAGGTMHARVHALPECRATVGGTLVPPACRAIDLAPDRVATPGLSAEGLSDLTGGVRIEVLCLEDENPERAFDVVLEAGAVDPHAWREVPAVSHDRACRLHLPTTRRTTIPFRTRLARGETVARDLVVDLTGRPALWRLTITRR